VGELYLCKRRDVKVLNRNINFLSFRRIPPNSECHQKFLEETTKVDSIRTNEINEYRIKKYMTKRRRDLEHSWLKLRVGSSFGFFFLR